jgi:hypothetical protein
MGSVFIEVSPFCFKRIISLVYVARGGIVVKAYTTNRQVAGSISDGVIVIFQ